MAWPSWRDFNDAVQDPKSCFADPDLWGEVTTDAMGLPKVCSGNFAVVYQIRGGESGRPWAVKCFTKPVPDRHQRYRAISNHLQHADLPFTVAFTYQEQGIRVRGTWYPIVKMDWVEGLTLTQFVRGSLDRPSVLEVLSQVWLKLAERLRQAEVTHGDLQHGNVLLVPGKSDKKLALKLVDYDGMWVPALATQPSGELGLRDYQHPQRLRENIYGPEVDRFSHLVIFAALRALRRHGSGLWDRYPADENFLFTARDFVAPAESTLLRELWHGSDGDLRQLAGRLILAAHGPLRESPELHEVAGEDSVTLLTAYEKTRVEKILKGKTGVKSSPLHIPDKGADLAIPPQATERTTALSANRDTPLNNREEIEPEPEVNSTWYAHLKKPVVLGSLGGGALLMMVLIVGLAASRDTAPPGRIPVPQGNWPGPVVESKPQQLPEAPPVPQRQPEFAAKLPFPPNPNVNFNIPNPGAEPLIKLELVHGQHTQKYVLDLGDGVDPFSRQKGKFFLVSLEAGKPYVLEEQVFGRTWRPNLRVEENLTRKRLAVGKIRGSTASTLFWPKETATYRITTTLGGGLGEFVFSIRELEVHEANGDVVINDQITRADPIWEKTAASKHYYKEYAFKLEAGSTYVFQMTNNNGQFAPYLDLHSKEGYFRQSSPPAIGTNCRVVFRSLTSDIYIGKATTSLPEKEGAFTLTVKREVTPLKKPNIAEQLPKPNQNPPYLLAINIPPGNGMYSSQFTFNAQDGIDPLHRQPCKIFQVWLQKGKRYLIDERRLSGNFTPYLRLEDQAGNQPAQVAGSGSNLNARIDFTPKEPASYRIIASSLSGGFGTFTLSVQELDGKKKPKGPLRREPGQANLVPNKAAPNVSFSKNLLITIPMNTITEKGLLKETRDLDVFDLLVGSGNTYTIEVKGAFTPTLRLFKDNALREPFPQETTGKEDVKRMVFRAEAPFRLYIVVGSDDERSGAYQISVTRQFNTPPDSQPKKLPSK